ncbi:MAG: hypothetical protein HYY03_01125 [Chloroflexi bacterium]|nr:hypothetical protein [Chloroflexota bacterium]
MRPSWQLDAKWLTAIAFVLCAAAACLTYSVYRLTAPGPATGTAAAVIEAMTKPALDNDLFAGMQEAARVNPQAEVTANGVTIPLRGEEIAGLGREEVLDRSAARLANILYYEGVEAGEAYFQDLTPGEEQPAGGEPGDPEDDGLQLEMLALFTQGSHNAVRPLVYALPLMAALLLAVLVSLSRGFGRLGSPGIALAVALGPIALVTTLLQGILKDGRESSEGAQAGAAAALQPPMADLAQTFTLLAGAGLAMAALAVGGSVTAVIVRRARRFRRSPAAATPAA